MNHCQQMAERLQRSRYAVALTGAGISVESGIPDFRSEGGFWARFDPMEYAHIDSFRVNPKKVWRMLSEMDEMLRSANPNPAHVALAEMEYCGILKEIVTQNVDSLHQRAGSRNVIEFHGHNRELFCDQCGRPFPREEVSLSTLPPLCGCGGPLRPKFVFFGEEIPADAYQRALTAARNCDFMLVVGTSATVAPASSLPRAAKKAGAFLLEINPATTELSYRMADLHIAEAAGKALPAIMAALGRIGRSQGK